MGFDWGGFGCHCVQQRVYVAFSDLAEGDPCDWGPGFLCRSVGGALHVWNLVWPFAPLGWLGGFFMGMLTHRSSCSLRVGPLRLGVSGCLFCE